MHLSNIKLWNFRKYWWNNSLNLSNPDFITKPDLNLEFGPRLNVLIWENDSWKTAIIDAIKLVLKTHSFEFIRVDENDFHKNSTRFRIELTFLWLDDPAVASHFTEWLAPDADWKMHLKVMFDVRRVGKKDNWKIFPSDVRAWADMEWKILTAEAKEYLLTTYLKPLRDAKTELIAKKNSRLSSIFWWHEAFKWKGDAHILMGHFKSFNESIEKYFEWLEGDGVTPLEDQEWKKLKGKLDLYMKEFSDFDSRISVAGWEELREVLEKLELSILDCQNPWLGVLNRLFIASELIHLERNNWTGLKLGLIEELEAHINPQNQMRVIESLQQKDKIQLILTTHSPSLASKVKIEHLILCHEGKAFPMESKHTKLEPGDYRFLERFLDSTKANLFFAKGVILVEWWAEELILPELAKKLKNLWIISKDLTEAGVSIVNVWSDTFLKYARIFQRSNWSGINIPVSIITDVDLRPSSYESCIEGIDWLMWTEKIEKLKKHRVVSVFTNEEMESEKRVKSANDWQSVKTFLSPEWTLEYCLWLSSIFAPLFFSSIKKAIQAMRVSGYTMAEESRDYGALSWTQEKIAFELYAWIMLKKKISKTIVAQYFSEELRIATFTKSDIEADTNIKYLIDAIKYVIWSR